MANGCTTCSLTVPANKLVWLINESDFSIVPYGGKDASGNLITHEITNTANGVGPDSHTRVSYDGNSKVNGATRELEKRYMFDLCLL